MKDATGNDHDQMIDVTVKNVGGCLAYKQKRAGSARHSPDKSSSIHIITSKSDLRAQIKHKLLEKYNDTGMVCFKNSF